MFCWFSGAAQKECKQKKKSEERKKIIQLQDERTKGLKEYTKMKNKMNFIRKDKQLLTRSMDDQIRCIIMNNVNDNYFLLIFFRNLFV